VVENSFGRGKSIYCVVPIETDQSEAGKSSFAALVRRLLGGPPTLASDAAPDIWLTAFDQPEHHRVMVSALCYRVEARPEPFPLNFTYRFPAHTTCTAVRVAVTGDELPFTAQNGAVSVALDAVDLFGMYLLEYQTTN
jgi:hypothetical protein